jgi:hypothetical protein
MAHLLVQTVCVNLSISRAVFLANILIVADDDKTRGARGAEMFGYKFLLASSLGIA